MMRGTAYIPDQLRISDRPRRQQAGNRSEMDRKPTMAEIIAWKQRHDNGDAFKALADDCEFSEKVIITRVRNLEAGKYDGKSEEESV